MRLVTFRVQDSAAHAGIVHENHVIALPYPTLLDVLRTPGALPTSVPEERTAYLLADVSLLPPIPEPPTLRDFYAFEQHVKTARAKRGLGMIPEWYEIPTFYFSNTSEIYGSDEPVPYPVG